MAEAKKLFYKKRGEILVKNLKNRHFEAFYCDTKAEALQKALSLIPEGATVSWGGCETGKEIGLFEAIGAGKYQVVDRAKPCATPDEQKKLKMDWMFSDVFISGANGLSLDGQMVNVDGTGNRVAATIYGPETVLIVAGMNKVTDTLEEAVTRARTIAAPLNQQRFQLPNPCTQTGTCSNCKSETCICNQIVITRNCRPQGRIKFILIGEDLGF